MQSAQNANFAQYDHIPKYIIYRRKPNRCEISVDYRSGTPSDQETAKVWL